MTRILTTSSAFFLLIVCLLCSCSSPKQSEKQMMNASIDAVKPVVPIKVEETVLVSSDTTSSFVLDLAQDSMSTALQFTLTPKQSVFCDISISDELGKSSYHDRFTVASRQHFEIPISTLEEGKYFFRMTYNNGTTITKPIKIIRAKATK